MFVIRERLYAHPVQYVGNSGTQNELRMLNWI